MFWNEKSAEWVSLFTFLVDLGLFGQISPEVALNKSFLFFFGSLVNDEEVFRNVSKLDFIVIRFFWEAFVASLVKMLIFLYILLEYFGSSVRLDFSIGLNLETASRVGVLWRRLILKSFEDLLWWILC